MVAQNDEEFKTLLDYEVKARVNGEDVRIINKCELKKLEPHLEVLGLRPIFQMHYRHFCHNIFYQRIDRAKIKSKCKQKSKINKNVRKIYNKSKNLKLNS